MEKPPVKKQTFLGDALREQFFYSFSPQGLNIFQIRTQRLGNHLDSLPVPFTI